MDIHIGDVTLPKSHGTYTHMALPSLRDETYCDIIKMNFGGGSKVQSTFPKQRLNFKNYNVCQKSATDVHLKF